MASLVPAVVLLLRLLTNVCVVFSFQPELAQWLLLAPPAFCTASLCCLLFLVVVVMVAVANFATRLALQEFAQRLSQQLSLTFGPVIQAQPRGPSVLCLLSM